MILIMAENFAAAELCAQEAGLRRADWRCLYDEGQLWGLREAIVWLVGDWTVPPRARVVQVFCEALGLVFLTKPAPGVKRKKARAKRRLRDKETGLLFERV